MPSVSAAIAQALAPSSSIAADSRNSAQRPPPASALHSHRAFAAGDESDGRTPWLAVRTDLAHERRHDFSHFACFARDRVAEDHGAHALGFEYLGCGFERAVRRGDNAVFDSRKSGVARLGAFRKTRGRS